MNGFMLLALAAMSRAKPEAGYSYSAPSRGHVGGGGLKPSGGGFGGGNALGLGRGGASGDALGGGLEGGSRFRGCTGSGGGFGDGSGSRFRGGSGGGYLDAPLIHKHIYSHVPQPETELAQGPRIIAPAVAAPQKHYKIVFIKAPSLPTLPAPVVPQLLQDKEKTLIYVLVKRPEVEGEIFLPNQKPTQPSKPEVYFIKYRTQNENQAIGGGFVSGIGGGVKAESGSSIMVRHNY